MKKTLCLLLALLMLGSMLAGCASTPAEPSNTTDNTQQANDSQTSNSTSDQPAENPQNDDKTADESETPGNTAIAPTESGSIMSDSNSAYDMWNKGAPLNFAKNVANYPANTAYPLTSEPTTLTCWMGWSSYLAGNTLESPNDSPAFQAACEKTGVNIEFTLATVQMVSFQSCITSGCFLRVRI